MVRVLSAAVAALPFYFVAAAEELGAGSTLGLDGVESLSLLQHGARLRIGLEAHVDFDAFVTKYNKQYGSAKERRMRQGHYEKTLARISAHKSKLWAAGVNHLADRSEDEFLDLLGWAGHKGARRPSAPAPRSFAAFPSPHVSRHEGLPEAFNWTKLEAVKNVRDQGQCGSCWAFATATVLTAHAEIHGVHSVFSPQQLVSCTPNPKHCGGTGGCGGATAELALEYALQKGLATEDEFPYTASDDECPDEWKADEHESSLSASPAALRAGFAGWNKLKENELLPVKTALVQEGPLAIAVAATQDWMWYETGIMDTCDEDAVLNHAVMLVGYSSEEENKYWLIQNSWTKEWGERGMVRLLRHDDKEEEAYCGWDTKPEDGSGCDGGPEKVRVCGSCGLLYDVVVPHFQKPSSQKSK